MAKKKFKHRAIEVGKETMISLCESCKHMPVGRVPQSNSQKDNSEPEQPFMYCAHKAFFPDVNYNNDGKPFYDVARCDGYELYKPEKSEAPRDVEITRADDE